MKLSKSLALLALVPTLAFAQAYPTKPVKLVVGFPAGGPADIFGRTFAQALSAYTRGAAYAGFAEDRIGSLEPGKWADFILVDRDPTRVDAQSVARTKVLETWVGGKKVWARAPKASPTERGK